jgi:4,5-DOPA dioxygenase extradiol
MKMPVLFIGHGSPMNIIAENSYTRSLQKLGEMLPRPKAVLVISAHWETQGAFITAAPEPDIIYDFYGFPPELYQTRYPCPGSPEVAGWLQRMTQQQINTHPRRGLDHAAWAVLKHLMPRADIPVLELSLDRRRTPQQHYQLAKQLEPLRGQGILIIGSGNIVHNLSRVNFDSLYGQEVSWAVEFDRLISQLLLTGDHERLIAYQALPNAHLAIPTDEHYLPLLYAVALQTPDDNLDFICSDIQNGSISMRSLMLNQSPE